MTILELYNRVSQLDTDKIITESVDETKDVILASNKEQLLEGKLSTGADISPTYQEDPFFKTPEAAQRYSDWKDKITPNPNRKPGVPNLFINGFFHNSIKIELQGDAITYSSNVALGGKIQSKYGDNIYGLNANFKSQYLDNYLSPLIRQQIESFTGLKFR